MVHGRGLQQARGLNGGAVDGGATIAFRGPGAVPVEGAVNIGISEYATSSRIVYHGTDVMGGNANAGTTPGAAPRSL